MFRAPLCPSSGALEWLLSVVFGAFEQFHIQSLHQTGKPIPEQHHHEPNLLFQLKKEVKKVGILFPHNIDDVRSKPHQIDI
jgi:hypothetical protein